MQRVLIVLAVWACIYLPALGSLEIKGEEGRRILPAVTMLETGNYVVPQVGSEPYFRKPPLINWLVAASFKLTGFKNEWSARLPSALSVLAAALVFAAVSVPTLGARGALFAALIWLTSFGLIEKGRLIEIEALYVSLFAIAFVCWFSWWQQRRSQWLTWVVPWIFLGLGLLAKGPVHLFFFYAIMLAALWARGELRHVLRPPHLIGVAVMLAIFLGWAVPCLIQANAAHVTTIWSRQFSGRLAGEGFDLAAWLMNIPRGVGYLLPWVLLVALIRVEAAADRRLFVALLVSTLGSFLIVNLIPGSLPRYAMPLISPAIWLLATAISAPTLTFRKWFGAAAVNRIVAAIVITTCICMIVFACAIVPHLQKRQKIKNIAAKIDAVVPRDQPVVAVDPQYQPFLFYVRSPLQYVSDVEQVPIDARYVLVQRRDSATMESSTRWLPRHPQQILPIKDYRGHETLLYSIQ